MDQVAAIHRVPSGRRVAARPRRWTRLSWIGAAAMIEVIAIVVVRSDVVDHAVELSLVSLCVAIAARLDETGRAVHALGLRIRSRHIHQLGYHLGELHRAMAVIAVVWFAVALASAAGRGDAIACMIGTAVLTWLMLIAWTARDAVRHDRHNRFEAIHRYGGWSALALVAISVGRAAWRSTPPTASLADVVISPTVVLVIVAVTLVIVPWIGIRRAEAHFVAVTDDVVVVTLPGRRSHGEFVRVSRGDGEWHAFAVSTTGNERDDQYSLVIRRAGDWTDRLARDVLDGRAPAWLRVRRTRGYGFMYHAQAYRRILVVATGAGIGPVPPYLLDPLPVDVHCLWIGRDHHRAMGRDLVVRVEASRRVTLIDTSTGRPDIGRCVAQRTLDMDAVFVVSNAAVRDEVARCCARLGVPWYGPTFDS